MLKDHFDCQNGCQGSVLGGDIPNYVTGSKPDLHLMCLTTESHQPKCNAKHSTTARICPCLGWSQLKFHNYGSDSWNNFLEISTDCCKSELDFLKSKSVYKTLNWGKQ